MKLVLTIFATFLLIIYANAQKETPNLPIDTVTKMIFYSEVVNVDTSLGKLELYSRAREWFAKAYNSSQNVIQMDDKESGKIVGKALTQVYHKALGSNYPSGYINYTISIYLKDRRYKYEISNFYHTGQLVSGGRIEDYGPCEEMINTKKKTWGMSYQKTFNYYLLQLDVRVRLLIEDLKKSMAGKAPNSKKNDW